MTMPIAPVEAPVEAALTSDQAPAAAPVTAPEAAKNEAPAKDPFADKLEVLAKKERAIWRQRQAIQAKEKEVQEKEARLQAFEQRKQKAKLDPISYLQEAGLSYDDLTEFMLSGGKPTEKSEVQLLREQFEEMRKAQEQEKEVLKRQQTEAQAAAQKQVIEDFKAEIGDFLKANASTYELTAQREAVDDIYSTIEEAYVISLQEWDRTGRRGPQPAAMDIRRAAEIVEEFYEQELLRLAQTAKFKSKLGVPAQAPETEAQRQPSKTLTNNMASTAASLVPAKTDADRMRRALEKLGQS